MYKVVIYGIKEEGNAKSMAEFLKEGMPESINIQVEEYLEDEPLRIPVPNVDDNV